MAITAEDISFMQGVWDGGERAASTVREEIGGDSALISSQTVGTVVKEADKTSLRVNRPAECYFYKLRHLCGIGAN